MTFATRWQAFAGVVALSSAACSLLVSADGLSGPTESSDGGVVTTDGASDAASGDGAPAVERKRRLFVIGGSSTGGAEPLSDVYESEIQDDGTLLPWRALGPLPYGVLGALPAAPSLVVLAGGYRSTSPHVSPNVLLTGVVEGGLSPVTESTVTMPGGRWRHTGTFHEGFLYVVGGTLTSDDSLTDVLVASVTGAQLSPFRATIPLPAGRSRACAAAAGDRLYVTGGYDESAATHPEAKTSVMARIAPNGDLTDGWTPLAVLQANRAYHGCFATQSHLYVLGGADDGDVSSAAFLEDGTVASWVSVGKLPEPRAGAAVVVANGHVYVIGGSSSGTVTSEVLVARIGDAGTLGTFSPQPPLPTARWLAMAFAR